MKKIILSAAAVIACSLGWAQYNSPWVYNISNASSGGYVGIGTKSTTTMTNTPVPAFNLHLHGTTGYSGPSNGGLGGPIYGVTTRIGLTNTTTQMGEFDGLVMRLSENHFTIQNQETYGNITLAVSGISFGLQPANGGRAFVGSSSINGTTFGQFNCVSSTDNGLFIRTMANGKYGLSIQSNAATDNAIQVIGTSFGTFPTFAVKANGATEIHTTSVTNSDNIFLVRNVALNKKLLQLSNDGVLKAREIYVDALWSDYVFEPNYNLLPLEEVQTYINENGHLPNVPTTAEMEKSGNNLAATDAKLLEKIEELTLYLLQQQEQLKLQNEQLLLMHQELETLKKGN